MLYSAICCYLGNKHVDCCIYEMDDINLHYRFLNWRRRIREIREVRAVRYQERYKRMLKNGDTLSYQGHSDEVGCYVAPRPLSKGNCYFEQFELISMPYSFTGYRL
ncbi:SPRY domain-containing protein 3-like [Sinocyclocheilus anshuiensis]|uniref:SPRY domain-containing protein 3-like n=1 Tax=Sinocyclocheilus anshuiensis TaxID=1608454 RepID=UPI0007BA33AA|nr:PREDICTED: SPRY domain-containing protein 3-like [Sinocyclocheilus anshuiensis]